MNILGAIIRTDEIVGISALQSFQEGSVFYYCFSIITKSSSVEFRSGVVHDVHIATKHELADLAEFKSDYLEVRTKVALLTGDPYTIVQEDNRTRKIESDFKLFCTHTDKLSELIKKSKIKTRDELLDQLGQAWVIAKDIKNLAV